MVPFVPETGNFRNDFPENFRNDIPEISVLRGKIVPEFRFSGTFSIMEMEKISRSFPYVNRKPEFRWKPYKRLGWVIMNLRGKWKVLLFPQFNVLFVCSTVNFFLCLLIIIIIVIIILCDSGHHCICAKEFGFSFLISNSVFWGFLNCFIKRDCLIIKCPIDT